MKMKNQEIKITINLQFKTEISLWNALKLRLCGGEAIKQYMEDMIKDHMDNDNGR